MTTIRLGSLKKYYAFGLVHLATLKEYTLDFFGGLAMLPIETVVIVLVWHVIYSYVGTLGNFDLDEMVAYQLLVHNIARATWSAGTINYRVWQDIYKGRLDVFLARPLDYQLSILCAEFGEIGVHTLLRIAMFVVACLVLRLPVQADPMLWGLFLVSAAGGIVIKFLEQFMIASLAFWTETIFGVRDLVVAISGLFSGRLIPVSLMPAFARTIGAALPFQFILSVPGAIYLEQYSRTAAWCMLGWEMLWIVAMVIVSRLLWQRGLVRYEAQGG
ncbi:MAG: ABC-2 family transporter protein [Anaerolineae bacterium]|nr:ABC-2 family transporter protein [Anaerolineae bacterium]